MNTQELLKRYNNGERDFSGANLRGASLRDANLRGANLCCADLCWADLRGANLRGANLRGASLRDANLRGANLRDANLPSPTMVMLASWGTVSDELCVDLMRFDTFCHNDPALFIRWANGGPCPYNNADFQRACNFKEDINLYTPGPCKNIHELMMRILSEKCGME